MSKKRLLLSVLFLLSTVLSVGCVKRTTGGKGTAGLYKQETETTTEQAATDVRSGTQEMVIVVGLEESESRLTVKSVADGRVFTLNYTGGTSVKNRYGTEMLMKDVILGEIAQVSYTPGTQKLWSMKESEEAWENTGVSRWSLDTDKKVLTIGSDKFSYDDSLVIISGNRQIDLTELNSADSLIVKGVDKKVYSIHVKVGHGYIKITDETNLVGGLIEVGNKIMKVITEGMIITAPEGTYTLTASKNGVGGSTEVVVKKDEETIVSLSSFQGEVERQGSVKFYIKPEGVNYNVFIDGTAVDVSSALPLSYGTHKVVVTSDTYTDYQEEIVISSIYMNKTIDLAAGTQTEETTASAEETTTVTSATEETTTVPSGTEETTALGEEREDGVVSAAADTHNNEVIISGPAGAEIYLDGVYMGKAPVTLTKSSGSHIFVLRASGYTTTAYSYTFDQTDTDVYIKFPDMKESST